MSERCRLRRFSLCSNKFEQCQSRDNFGWHCSMKPLKMLSKSKKSHVRIENCCFRCHCAMKPLLMFSIPGHFGWHCATKPLIVLSKRNKAHVRVQKLPFYSTMRSTHRTRNLYNLLRLRLSRKHVYIFIYNLMAFACCEP